jgi:hypothetical protein
MPAGTYALNRLSGYDPAAEGAEPAAEVAAAPEEQKTASAPMLEKFGMNPVYAGYQMYRDAKRGN